MMDDFNLVSLFAANEEEVEESAEFLSKLNNCLMRSKNLLDIETCTVRNVMFFFSFVPSKNKENIILRTCCSIDKRKTVSEEYDIDAMTKILDDARLLGLNIHDEENLQVITSRAMTKLEEKYYKDKYIPLYNLILDSNFIFYKNEIPIFAGCKMNEQENPFVSISTYVNNFNSDVETDKNPMMYLEFRTAKSQLNKTIFSNIPDPCKEFMENSEESSYKFVFFDKKRDKVVSIDAVCNNNYNFETINIKVLQNYNNLKDVVYKNYDHPEEVFNYAIDKNLDADLMDMLDDII